jgi:hypothetical protein
MPDVLIHQTRLVPLPLGVAFPACLEQAGAILHAAGHHGPMACRLSPRDAQAWDAYVGQASARHRLLLEQAGPDPVALAQLAALDTDAGAWRGYQSAYGVIWMGYGPDASWVEGWVTG